MSSEIQETKKSVQTVVLMVLTAWLLWVSKAIVELQSEVAVIKFGVFHKLSENEATKDTQLSGMGLLPFPRKEK